MQVTLAPNVAALIVEKLESGRCSSPSDVVEEALHRLDEHDRLERLRAAIRLGLEDIARGDVTDWTADSMAELLAEADAEDERNLPIADDVRN